MNYALLIGIFESAISLLYKARRPSHWVLTSSKQNSFSGPVARFLKKGDSSLNWMIGSSELLKFYCEGKTTHNKLWWFPWSACLPYNIRHEAACLALRLVIAYSCHWCLPVRVFHPPYLSHIMSHQQYCPIPVLWLRCRGIGLAEANALAMHPEVRLDLTVFFLV